MNCLFSFQTCLSSPDYYYDYYHHHHLVILRNVKLFDVFSTSIPLTTLLFAVILAADSHALSAAEHHRAALPRVCAQLHEEDVPQHRAVPELGRGRACIRQHYSGPWRRSRRDLNYDGSVGMLPFWADRLPVSSLYICPDVLFGAILVPTRLMIIFIQSLSVFSWCT